MQESAKYLIHAEIRTAGVVERSDVVGAVFGQTEGLLGEELDLRELQEASKVGRIDVDIESADGNSVGTITVASGLDRVETAVLAASFETIDRVGPSRADCTVVDIEDVREAKRREVVDRATELLTEFEQEAMRGDRLVEAVRERARVEEITEFAGLPAGPRVEESDAVILVEGRADVRQLLRAGIKNALAVEGTNVPQAVSELTSNRTTTTFLDGDRGGDLILQELEQVGNIDYVAFAPRGRAVEDLSQMEIRTALHRKLPFDQVASAETPREAYAGTGNQPDGDTQTDSSTTTPETEQTTQRDTPLTTAGVSERSEAGIVEQVTDQASNDADKQRPDDGDPAKETVQGPPSQSTDDDTAVSTATTTESEPVSGSVAQPAVKPTASDEDEKRSGVFIEQVESILDTGMARFLNEDGTMLQECNIGEAVETLDNMDTVPETVLVDGPITQQLLDIGAQRDVTRMIGTGTDQFVKEPTSVGVTTTAQLLKGGASPEPGE